jgi:hypothetical protein
MNNSILPSIVDSSSKPLSVIIIEKTGVLKSLQIKSYKEEELFKKCGYKSSNNFKKQIQWSCNIEKQKYIIYLYGKVDGVMNSLNNYHFPPSLNKKKILGNCVLVCMVQDNENLSKQHLHNLSLGLWNTIYEKLIEPWNNDYAVNQENEFVEDSEVDMNDNDVDINDNSNGNIKKLLPLINKNKIVKMSMLESPEEDIDDDSTNSVISCSSESDNKSQDQNYIEDNLVIEDICSELTEESYDIYEDDE